MNQKKIKNFLKKQDRYHQYVLDDMKKNTLFTDTSNGIVNRIVSLTFDSNEGDVEFEFVTINESLLPYFSNYNNKCTQNILNFFRNKHSLQYNEMSYIYRDWLDFISPYILNGER
jgi:hypothetical protein